MVTYSESPLGDLLFENHPLPLWIYDLQNLAFLAVNHAAIKKYGFSREEFLKLTIMDIRPSEDVLALLELVSGERPFLRNSGIWHHRMKNGLIIDVEISSHLLTFDGRDAALVVIQDVSDRKRAEEQAQLHENRFTNFVNSAMDAVISLNNQHQIVLFNPTAQRMFGFHVDEILGRPLDVILPEQFHAVHKRHMERFHETGITTRAMHGFSRLTGKRKNGQEFPLEASISQIDIGGEKLFTAILRDVSEAQQAEMALRESEEKYRAVVENANDGITIIQHGQVSYVNPKLAEMRGEDASKLLGQRFEIFVEPTERAKIIARYRRRLIGLQADTTYETTLLRQDNTQVPVELTTNLITYQGEPAEIVIVRDISERKLTEESIKRQLQEMIVLNTVTTAGAEAQDIDELATRITDAIGQTLYPDNCGILLVDHEKKIWWPHPSYQRINAVNPMATYSLSQGVAGKVMRNGERAWLGDVRKEPAYVEATSGILSELAVPIFANGKVFGCLNVESRQLNAFSEHDERFVRTVAESMSTAVEKILWLEMEKQRRKEAEALRESTLALTYSMEPEKLYETILDTLQKLIPYDSASIELTTGNSLEIVAGRNIPSRIIGTRYADAPEKWGDLEKLRNPVIIPDVQSDDRFVKFEGTNYIRGWMGIPLFAHDKLIGYINLDSRTANFYGPSHISMAQIFGNQAAIAIENMLLFQESVQQARESSAIAEIGRDISGILQLGTVLEKISIHAKTLLNAETAAVYLPEAQGQALQAVTAVGLDSAAIRNYPLQIGQGILGSIAQRKYGEIVNDTFTNPRAITIQGTEKNPLEHIMGVPVLSQEQLTGLIAVWRTGAGQEFKPRELDFLNSLAQQAAVAIENARLFENTRQRLAEIEGVHTVSTALRSAQTLDAALPIILDQLVELLNAGGACLEMIDATTNEIVTAMGYGGWVHVMGMRTPQGSGVSGHVLATGQPYVSDDVIADGKAAKPDLFAGLHMVACVPVIAQHHPIGTLWIGRQTPIHKEEVSLLAAVGEMIGHAIQRIKLHEQTEQLLDELQIANRELSGAYDTTLEGWAKALELRDKETEGHSRRVTELTLRLAREFGLPEQELVHIRRGVLLHDIGKMGIPDQLLRKSTSLTTDEWIEMRKHPQYAYDLLRPIAYLKPALDIPYCHHEKWDGSGYPQGLKERDIPLAARMFEIVDVYDALSFDRPYRSAWSQAKVCGYLCEQSGKHFDPEIVPVFLKLLDSELSGKSDHLK